MGEAPSGWELGGSKHNQGVCVCGRLAGGQAGVCMQEGEGAWGRKRGRLALPCRLAAGEDRGKEEGSWRPGLLRDEASRPNGGGQAARGLRWGDRSHGTLSTVRPQLMSGVQPTPILGTTWEVEVERHWDRGFTHVPACQSLVGSGAVCAGRGVWVGGTVVGEIRISRENWKVGHLDFPAKWSCSLTRVWSSP